MTPLYATLTSSGSTPWKTTGWYVTPPAFGVSVVSTGGAAWTIDVTFDDPTRTFPNPSTSSQVLSFYNSSQLIGSSLSGNSSGGVLSQAFSMSAPIAAWRLTVNSSLGPVTASSIQFGIG